MLEISATTPPVSWARVADPGRAPLRVALVQHRWQADPAAVRAELREGISRAAARGAAVVFLPELTLSRYPADTLPAGAPNATAEELLTGPTFNFAAQAARDFNITVHASLFQRADAGDGLGLNTAILVSPDGELLARTHKLHIPRTDGYFEDRYFRPGPGTADAYQVHAPAELKGARLGMPTCWDEWFPEVARMYSLGGAELLVYPTAIGSEPAFPNFDTQPLWQQVIVGNGIANGLFMVVPNRWGHEGTVDFYGSSFISDPYGRILIQAPRGESAVLIADLDLAQRAEWLELFPFLATRRPETYARLTAPVDAAHPYGDPAAATTGQGR